MFVDHIYYYRLDHIRNLAVDSVEKSQDLI